MRLQGRRAVVTGGASGLGEATVRRFHEEGARVVVADLDAGRASAVARSLAPDGRTAAGLACDITDPDQCEKMVTEAETLLGGPIDIFHANAGMAFSGGLLDAEDERIERTIAVNVTGTIFSARAALRSLVRGGGVLLFTSSFQGVSARPERSVYTATKHAVTGLVKSLSLEFGPKGVRVNAMAPIGIDTPLLRQQLARVHADTDAAIAGIAAGLPLRRMLTLRDFANAALFLASDEARCITGHTLVIDCGASAGTMPVQPVGATQ
jgi:NAD(P)-dependent dehydrogenase (short-subunit alcohol dehydrogenase family)